MNINPIGVSLSNLKKSQQTNSNDLNPAFKAKLSTNVIDLLAKKSFNNFFVLKPLELDKLSVYFEKITQNVKPEAFIKKAKKILSVDGGYKIYTFDKEFNNLIKFVKALSSNNKKSTLDTINDSKSKVDFILHNDEGIFPHSTVVGSLTNEELQKIKPAKLMKLLLNFIQKGEQRLKVHNNSKLTHYIRSSCREKMLVEA